MKVLVAEDEAVTRLMLKAFLKDRGFDVVDVSDGDQAWAALQGPEPPRLAILDWVMPGKEGPELCRLVRDRERADGPYTYLILLTAKSDKGDVVSGIEGGADDYIVKPFDRDELYVRVRAGQRLIDLQSKLLDATKALAEQATHDALTGTWNRRAIMQALDNELARANREGKSLLVALGDVDRFKQINDTHGHLAGDEVLREVVRRICANLRAYDSVGRYGGEEFLLLMPGGAQGAEHAPLDRVLAAIGETPFDVAGTAISVTCSFGAACFRGARESGPRACDAHALLRVVDQALYAAKEAGRNRIVCAVDDTPSPVESEPSA